MKVIYNFGKGLKGFDRPRHNALAGRPYAALGIFDGLHLGHQYILKKMLKEAGLKNKKTVCITFYPHPEKILSSKNIFVHLVSLEHRLRFIEDLGIDACIVINFNRHFSQIAPEHFIKILKEKINPKAIFVGKNFTFGRGAAGDINLLKDLSKKYDFDVRVIAPLRLNNKIISSTLIRTLIREGKLDLAKKYLGRNVTILGKVIRGKQAGRKLGYHTANIDTGHEIIPPAGVYAARVKIKNKKFKGVAYIGTSPTLHFRLTRPRLEVYIMNFHKNIYGKKIEVEFIKKIRQEEMFPALRELSAQIKQDIVSVRSILP